MFKYHTFSQTPSGKTFSKICLLTYINSQWLFIKPSLNKNIIKTISILCFLKSLWNTYSHQIFYWIFSRILNFPLLFFSPLYRAWYSTRIANNSIHQKTCTIRNSDIVHDLVSDYIWSYIESIDYVVRRLYAFVIYVVLSALMIHHIIRVTPLESENGVCTYMHAWGWWAYVSKKNIERGLCNRNQRSLRLFVPHWINPQIEVETQLTMGICKR